MMFAGLVSQKIVAIEQNLSDPTNISITYRSQCSKTLPVISGKLSQSSLVRKLVNYGNWAKLNSKYIAGAKYFFLPAKLFST
jgi:hypothetical protein